MFSNGRFIGFFFIGEHLAVRAVPDESKCCSTKAGVGLDSCGGWLYISPLRNKMLLLPLHHIHGKLRPNKCMFQNLQQVTMWQTTIFPSALQDLLLYLRLCRKEGYFSVLNNLNMEIFSAHEVLLHIWNRQCVGRWFLGPLLQT